MDKKCVNGKYIELTKEEQAARDAMIAAANEEGGNDV